MPLSSTQTADIQKQYDPMRKKAQQQEAANLQGQRDALARRAAQLGGGPSGALVKQESIAADASARRLGDANEAIGAQEQGAMNQAREVQAQRDYQTGERVASQTYASGESAMDRKLQQALGEGQLLGVYNGTSTLAKTSADTQTKLAQEQLKLQKQTLGATQAQQQLENTQNIKTNLVNTMVTMKNSGYSPEQIGGVIQSLGYDWADLGIDPSALFAGQTPAAAAPKPVAAAPAPGVNTQGTGTSKVYYDENGRRYTLGRGGVKTYI